MRPTLILRFPRELSAVIFLLSLPSSNHVVSHSHLMFDVYLPGEFVKLV